MKNVLLTGLITFACMAGISFLTSCEKGDDPQPSTYAAGDNDSYYPDNFNDLEDSIRFTVLKGFGFTSYDTDTVHTYSLVGYLNSIEQNKVYEYEESDISSIHIVQWTESTLADNVWTVLNTDHFYNRYGKFSIVNNNFNFTPIENHNMEGIDDVGLAIVLNNGVVIITYPENKAFFYDPSSFL